MTRCSRIPSEGDMGLRLLFANEDAPTNMRLCFGPTSASSVSDANANDACGEDDCGTCGVRHGEEGDAVHPSGVCTMNELADDRSRLLGSRADGESATRRVAGRRGK